MSMEAILHIFKELNDLRDFIQSQRSAGKTIALVPTMGALHAGHLSLVKKGLELCDICIASIYVNPTQFAPHEDFDTYPREENQDIQKLDDIGAHAIWMPSQGIMYPEGDSTRIVMSNISEPLEGEFRPHFFHGVATVVAKLLLQALPDKAIFGEKDYQQLQVVKRLVRDMSIPVEIVGGEIVRDESGLALSSRNAYLSESEYEIALNINKTLRKMREKLQNGDSISDIENWARQHLIEVGFDKVDYCAIRDTTTLMPTENETSAKRGLIATTIGKTRLIDNAAM